jgi:hypothetical protein
MSLLMYAVSTAPAAIAGIGLGGSRLEGIEHDGLLAIVSAGTSSPLEPTEENLWEYDQALERLMAPHVILPARFGTFLRDRAAVVEMLQDRRSELLRALERVRGAVEFGITTGWREAGEPIDSDSGTAYLLGRLALHRRASEVARRLDPLAALSRSSRQRVLPRPSLPVTGSYLVEQTRSEEFIDLVAHIDQLLQEVDVVCTGPWPPYSFVEGVPQ